MIPENIHTYTLGDFFEFRGQGGFFELEIQRHGGYLRLEFQGQGRGEVPEGADKSVIHEQTDDTTDNWGKQDTR